MNKINFCKLLFFPINNNCEDSIIKILNFSKDKIKVVQLKNNEPIFFIEYTKDFALKIYNIYKLSNKK